MSASRSFSPSFLPSILWLLESTQVHRGRHLFPSSHLEWAAVLCEVGTVGGKGRPKAVEDAGHSRVPGGQLQRPPPKSPPKSPTKSSKIARRQRHRANVLSSDHREVRTGFDPQRLSNRIRLFSQVFPTSVLSLKFPTNQHPSSHFHFLFIPENVNCFM